MNNPFGKTAVVTIDLHRGHLDPNVATLPLTDEQSERVVEENKKFLAKCREQHIPVIHVVTVYRNVDEILNNRYWNDIQTHTKASRKNIYKHNMLNSPGTELMPGIYEQGDYIVSTKKRYNCFYQTDLQFLLESLQVETILFTGVNTNSCVLASSTYASCLNYRVVIVKNCVDSMDGPELHEAALKVIESAYGSTYSSEEILSRIASV
jgi:nicotinamidase-related amidase